MISFKRRIFIVYPEAQIRMIVLFVLAGIVGFIGLAYGAYEFINKMLLVLGPAEVRTTIENQLLIKNLWSYFTIYCISFAAGYLLLLIAAGIIFSNSIVGPVVRVFEDLIGMIESNEYRPIRLRKNDYFKKLVAQINKSIDERLKKTVQK